MQRNLQATLISVVMGALLIIDELFDIKLHTLTEDYIGMLIGVVWPILVWLTAGWPRTP